MNFYEGKNVVVTGGTGLIGRPLVRKLIEKKANVRIVSLDDPSRAHPDAEFLQLNLTRLKIVWKLVKEWILCFT